MRAGFACPDPLAPVTVHIDVLTDVNDAYRTVLPTDGDGDVLFTATAPEHEVDLAGGGAAGGGLALLGILGGLVVLAAVVLGVVLARRSGSAQDSEQDRTVTA